MTNNPNELTIDNSALMLIAALAAVVSFAASGFIVLKAMRKRQP